MTEKFKFSLLLLLVIFLVSCSSTGTDAKVQMQAPAYPLITIDPYTSAWSTTDNLFDSPVKHWTGKDHPLIGVIRVDGKTYRFMGKETSLQKNILPTATFEDWKGTYTFHLPEGNWELPGYNDSEWETGIGAFGTPEMPNVSTLWETREIWVRRNFFLPDSLKDTELYLSISYDDDFQLFINGQKFVEETCCGNNHILKLDKDLLKFGQQNTIAAYCINLQGAALVDFGILQDNDVKELFTQTAIQKNVELSATQTTYQFACGPVDLSITFTSPLLPDQLELLSRPINYIDYSAVANDGKNHDVQVYFEATPQWAVNVIKQPVEVTKGELNDLMYLKAGTIEQPILERKGDDVRIDWGYFYFGQAKSAGTQISIGDYSTMKKDFMDKGALPSSEKMITTSMTKFMPAMACANSIGTVGKTAKSGSLLIGFDDIESIQYFGKNLKAIWKQDGKITMNDALADAFANHDKIVVQCNDFDEKLMNDALKAGGKTYADLCILAFRQSVAAHKLVKDTEGNLLFLSKENFSNGSIGTVDVTYPSAPLYLKYNPELLKGMLTPIFYYSESGKWTKPFAAHDVGTYPKANGQTYGGDMPVEECGNMIILTAAIANVEGNADYAQKHWETLTTWANYLLENGLDPENQLCTDDFAGHFAHNVNLSAKAIMGIASYGQLAEMIGKTDIAQQYTSNAKQMAQQWMEMASDGDHYRLTFDQPGTWSQKYNLVWDKILGLDIFPKAVLDTEIKYYLTKQNKYGLPLDNRKVYTKSDWVVWTATLADNQQDFEALISPMHQFVEETPDRSPMTDWYQTTDASRVGFTARSVVGGYFIKMLVP